MRSKNCVLRLLWTNKSPLISPIKTHDAVHSNQTTTGLGSCKSLFLPRCRPPSHQRPGVQAPAPPTEPKPDPDSGFSAPSLTLSLFNTLICVSRNDTSGQKCAQVVEKVSSYQQNNREEQLNVHKGLVYCLISVHPGKKSQKQQIYQQLKK